MTDQHGIDPSKDGIDHINVYSRGTTALGRNLSNFADCNIEHPYHGYFRTLEGLWYFMKTGFETDEFRVVKGHTAREMGKRTHSELYPLFSKMFKLGMIEKIDSNPRLKADLIRCDLPLQHYYVYGGKVFNQHRHQWQLDYWTLLRSTLINTGSLDLVRDELISEIEFHMKRHSQADD